MPLAGPATGAFVQGPAMRRFFMGLRAIGSQGSPGAQSQEEGAPEGKSGARRGQARCTALCQVQRKTRKSQGQHGLRAL